MGLKTLDLEILLGLEGGSRGGQVPYLGYTDITSWDSGSKRVCTGCFDAGGT